MSALAAYSDDTRTITQTLPDWVYDVLQDDTEQRRFWITKGLGAGGTYGAAIWHYCLCEINDESRFSWVLAPTFNQIADTLIPTFVDVLENIFSLNEAEDFEIIRSQFPRINLLGTGQSILFKSANRPERLVGATISHCMMTEPGLIKRQAYEKSSARLRCPKARRLQYLGEGSPEGLGDFFDQEANFAPGVDERNNKARIVLHTQDNPVLKPSYVDMLTQTYSHDPQKLESYIRGQFVAFTKGTAYWDFKHSRNITLGIEGSPQLPITMAWDWNHTPLAWVALQVQPNWSRQGVKFDRYTVLNESTGLSNGIPDACAEFIAMFPPEQFKNTPIEVDGGCDGYFKSHLSNSCAFDQVLAALRRYYTNVRVVAARSAPRIKDRLQKHNALLAHRYLVLPAWCRNTIKSHETTNLKPNTWDIDKPRDDKTSHWGDALGYALFRLTKHIDLNNPNAKQIFGFN